MNTMHLTSPTTRRSQPQGSLIDTDLPSFRTAADVAAVEATPYAERSKAQSTPTAVQLGAALNSQAVAMVVASALALTSVVALAQAARPADVEGIALVGPGETGVLRPVMATTPADVLYLFQPARLAPASPSAMVTIDFNPAQWRVGAIDGPVATAAQLREVLDDLQGIVVSGACANAAADTRKPVTQACAFALRHPDYVGPMNPASTGHVLGWAMGAGPQPGAGAGLSVAQRYFGLLDPVRFAGSAGAAAGTGAAAQLAMRFDGGADMLMPSGFVPQGSALILHNDQRSPLVPQAYAVTQSAKRRDANVRPLRVDLSPPWAVAVSLPPAPLLASVAAPRDIAASK